MRMSLRLAERLGYASEMASHRTLLPAFVLSVALLPACGSKQPTISVNPPGPNGEPGIGDGAGPPPADPADPADPAEPADPDAPADPTIAEPADPDDPADPESR